MSDRRIFRYEVHSGAHLKRARVALEAFDAEGAPQQLFVGALELRYGIEARLFEYIAAELPSESRQQQLARLSQSAATKLLAHLTRLNPKSKHRTRLSITPQQGGTATVLYYTPVTSSLARIHGRLGELLHHNYFHKNPHWYVAGRPKSAGMPTLLLARDLIAQGIVELQEATAGSLLSNAGFRRRLDRLLADSNE